MKLKLGNPSPSITNMIRIDHTHVLMLFRRFHPDTSLSRKQALVTNACLAIEVHAQLEEEIFYPALQSAGLLDATLDKSVLEHDGMRELISTLRAMEPEGPQYDEIFRELMRTVLHHVADEETTLLPQAEEKLPGELSRLGAQMTRRRLQLLKPHLGELASTTARSFPMATAAAALAGVTLLWLIFGKRTSART